jgi:hypothetical protein
MRIFRLYNRFEKKNILDIDTKELYSPSIAYSWNSFVNELVSINDVRYWDDMFFEMSDTNSNFEVFDLILLNYYNQSYSHEEVERDSKSYLNEFLASKNKNKILIDCTCCFVDPQEFTLGKLGIAMYKSNVFDLYSPILFEQLKNYNMIISKMNKSFDDFHDITKNHSVVIFRLAQVNSFWKRFEKREFFLPFFKAPHEPIDFINEGNIALNDVVLSGNKSSFIYPFRNSIREKFNNKINNFKTIDTYDAYLFDRKKLDDLVATFTYSSKSNQEKLEYKKNLNLIYKQTVENYQFFIRNSKIGIVCSSIYGYPVAKYFEFFSQGTLVIGDMPIDANEYGLINNETMVECTLDNVDDKVLYYLKHPRERERITRNALDFIHTVYNPKNNISLMLKEINSHLDKKECSR